jgi:hypothetical protein
MNDVLGVGLDYRSRDLGAVEEHRFEGKRSALQPPRQRLALHQFHHQIVGANIVKRADVRVIQRRNRPRLARKAVVKLLARSLDRNGAA